MTALWTDPETGIEHDLDAVRFDHTDEQYRKEVGEICARFRCSHDRSEPVWATTRNGKRQLREQCADCGELFGTALKHELADRFTPPADTSKADRRDQARQNEIRQAAIRLIVRQREWWSWYDNYLTTDEWLHKRKLVFQRCAGIC